MFSFFQKKTYLVDYLHGLVDMHNHILPGIDDGAKTVDDSIGLLKGFGEMGVTHFICTPHIMHNHYDNTPETIQEAHTTLISKLEKNHLSNISIAYAAEHMIDDNFETILENDQVIALKDSFLLVEMSYLQPSFNFEIAVEKMAKLKYFPVLAHPERYMYFHRKYGTYQKMKVNGIQFQLNLLSLTPESYGSSVQKMALKLLQDHLVDFVGSDVHNLRQLELLKETTIQNKVLNLLLPVIENTIETFY